MIAHHAFHPPIDAELQQQRQRSVILSLLLALIGLLLVGGILYLFKILSIESIPPKTVIYSGAFEPEETPQPKKISMSRKMPSAPAAAASRIIASARPAELAIPDIMTPEISMDFGEDFGPAETGWGEGWNDDAWNSSNGSVFGSSGTVAGALKGRLYDFKQDRNKEPNLPYLEASRKVQRDYFVKYVSEIHRKKFSDSSLARYFVAPQELSLTHLAISNRPAVEGPRYFGAEQDMQPRAWMAHYSGDIVAPEDGHYRFSGISDDYLSVHLNGRPRLIACWPDIQTGIAGRWEEARREKDKWGSPIGRQHLIYGDWVKLRKGQKIHMDLGIGERPGGRLGFLLMVEKKGTRYRHAPDGRPILPLFATAPFSTEKINEIRRDFPSFEFEWKNVPIFRAE